MRVCVVTPYDLAEAGGVRRHVEHLTQRLRALGDEVVLVGPHSGSSCLPNGVLGLRGVVPMRSNGSNSRPGILVSPWSVRRIMRRRFDVVHVMEPIVPSLGWYAAWFGGAAARVATFHSFAENEAGLSRFVRKGVGAAQCSFFHRGIAVSQSAARFAAPIWRGPLALIPNGVDTDVFSPAPAPAGEEIRLLFVGHWHNPRKGLPVLLAAYALLRARGVPVVLDVVGDGRQRVDLPGVAYHAAISDERALAARYRAADLFVAPSLGSESFGIVLLEAMACGRPIVCSDIEGYRSVVPSGGARMVPPGDPAALANAIAAVAASRLLQARMGEINRQAALAYDWSLIAERVRGEYEAATRERRALW